MCSWLHQPPIWFSIGHCWHLKWDNSVWQTAWILHLASLYPCHLNARSAQQHHHPTPTRITKTTHTFPKATHYREPFLVLDGKYIFPFTWACASPGAYKFSLSFKPALLFPGHTSTCARIIIIRSASLFIITYSVLTTTSCFPFLENVLLHPPISWASQVSL